VEKLASDVDKEEKIWVKLIVSAHVLERIAQVASTAHIRYGISIGEVRQRWEEIKNYRSDLLLSYNLIKVNSSPFLEGFESRYYAYYILELQYGI
jgi:hypothetical protein